ncbi:MAG: hypothetical protein AAFS10_02755, partial [Myxococcota bacterium]
MATPTAREALRRWWIIASMLFSAFVHLSIALLSGPLVPEVTDSDTLSAALNTGMEPEEKQEEPIEVVLDDEEE